IKIIYMNAQRLVKARKEKGLSQRELGEALGTEDSEQARGKIRRYERGGASPTYKTVCEIAEILNVPECYFYIKDDLFAEQVLLLFKKNLSDETENNLITTLKEKNKQYEKALKNIQKEIDFTNSL
ncbi:helix-turn-helix domain-containing protein, partial [Xenorhabdus bovienii]|uniref:helix-turn-helix domain-containing protein n=1 Tax=Xenorhabdus bovienii TaxID=40576 RepID=UPI0023B33AB6